MNRNNAIKERAQLTERIEFLDAVISATRQKPKAAPYGCQQYAIDRLCRFDRRAIDRGCDGCQRTTDSEYLQSMGLWISGISHKEAAA